MIFCETDDDTDNVTIANELVLITESDEPLYEYELLYRRLEGNYSNYSNSLISLQANSSLVQPIEDAWTHRMIIKANRSCQCYFEFILYNIKVYRYIL